MSSLPPVLDASCSRKKRAPVDEVIWWSYSCGSPYVGRENYSSLWATHENNYSSVLKAGFNSRFARAAV